MNRKNIMLVCMVMLVSLVLSACGGNNGGNSGDEASSSTIKIGAQTYSEPKILAEMYKALIEDRLTNIKVEILPDLAASPIVIQAMKDNEIQMATLYSKKVFNGYFDTEPTKDRQEVLKMAQEGFDEHFDFKWFDSYGFENTYAFTIRKAL